MLKNISRIECKVADRVYQLLCDQDSPIEHVKEALFQLQKYVGNIEDQLRKQQEAIKVEEVQPPQEKVEEIK